MADKKPIARLIDDPGSRLSNSGLNKQALESFQRLQEKINSDPIIQTMLLDNDYRLTIADAFRSREQQEAAYAKKQAGKIAAAAKPGTGKHEFGLAFDIGFTQGGKPGSIAPTALYKRMRELARESGFKTPLSMAKDPGHIEISNNRNYDDSSVKAAYPTSIKEFDPANFSAGPSVPNLQNPSYPEESINNDPNLDYFDLDVENTKTPATSAYVTPENDYFDLSAEEPTTQPIGPGEPVGQPTPTGPQVQVPQDYLNPTDGMVSANKSANTQSLLNILGLADKAATGMGLGLLVPDRHESGTTLTGAAQALYESLGGTPDITSPQRKAILDAQIQTAQQQMPVSSTIAQLLGFTVPGKVIGSGVKALLGPLAQSSKVLPQVITGAVTGGAEGAGYEALTNPNATASSVLSAGKTGAMAGGAVVGAGKAIENVGSLLAGWRMGNIKLGDFINKTYGPTLNKASLKEKAAASLVKTEEKLQDVLTKHSDKVVQLDNIISPTHLKKMSRRIKASSTSFELDEMAKVLDDFAVKLESVGGLSPSEANILKRHLWDLSYTQKGNQKLSTIADAAFKQGKAVKNAIETTLGTSGDGKLVRSLNMRMGSDIQLKQALGAKVGLYETIREVGRGTAELSGAWAHPESIPYLLAGRAATTIPGSTLIGAAGRSVQKGATAIAPILNALGIK